VHQGAIGAMMFNLSVPIPKPSVFRMPFMKRAAVDLHGLASVASRRFLERIRYENPLDCITMSAPSTRVDFG
jgi:hypothetical protein